MAMPRCTLCEENEGILMASRLDDGTTAVVCPTDLLVYSLAMAVQYTQDMTVESAESVGKLLDQLYANDPRQPKPAGKRRKSATAAVAATEEPVASAEVSWPVPVPLIAPCTECGSSVGEGYSDRLVCQSCGAVIATEAESGT